LKTNYDIELDLHGMTYDEAVRKLESVIYFAPPGYSILVIHGVGGGVLREKLREYIRDNSFINDYYYGEDLNLPGGFGVTIIYL
jgi:dsDNA-specific endonuclease/ATPase MutS2